MEMDAIALPGGGGFELWRWVCLRGAGFPAAGALDLAADDSAAAADDVLAADEVIATCEKAAKAAIAAAFDGATPESIPLLRKALKKVGRGAVPPVTGTTADDALAKLREAHAQKSAALASYEIVFAGARRRVFTAAQRIAADPRFREAVAWQNRAAIESALDRLTSADPAAPRSKERQHEVLVASQFWRYTTKNDTIGFFGPVGWARLDPAAPRITVVPGEQLLAARHVYFEQWPIDVLASRLSADERMIVWQRPWRFGFVRLTEAGAESPLSGRVPLSPASQAVLSACDAERSAARIARELVAARPDLFADEPAVLSTLRELRDKKLIGWTFETRTGLFPEAALRRRIEWIGDDALRAEALRPLETLEAARQRVADAAGDAQRVNDALAVLETTFTTLTGAPASRHAGLTYAGRGLVFEDCRRDLDVVLGPKLLEEIGPALSLVLQSSRWLTVAVADAYRKAFRVLYTSLAARARGPVVQLADFWFRSQRLFHGKTQRPIDDVMAELHRRWGGILGVEPASRRRDFTSATLKAAVAEAFPADRPGWEAAKHHSPDLMICASSVDELARGEYLAVLGEVHVAANTLDGAFWRAQHPRPGDVEALFAADLREPRVLPIESKGALRATGRGESVHLSNDYDLEVGFETSELPRDHALRLADLFLEDVGGSLIVRDKSGRTRFDLVELMGTQLSVATVNAFDVLPPTDPGPRVTIDRLVVRRERWKLSAAELAFAHIESEPDRFLAARRWAQGRGLPRHVFLKSSLEVKPVFVDFASPVSIKIVSRLVRHVAEEGGDDASLSASEMLPTIGETWLPDARGERYACELRLVAVDTATSRSS